MKNVTHLRLGLGSLPIGAPPALLWADTLFSLALGWRPLGDIEHLGCGLLAFWLAVAAAFLGSQRGRRVVSGRCVELLFAAIIICLGWFMAELYAMRAVQALRPEQPFHSRGVNLRLLFDPVPGMMSGLDGPAVYTTDGKGVRSPYAAGAARVSGIICVGGSSTECTYLDDRETWPARLMEELNRGDGKEELLVGNLGVSGYSTREHFEFLCSHDMPDGLRGVILQTGINDLWRHLANEDEDMDLERFADKPAEFRPLIAPIERRKPYWTRSKVIELYHTVMRSRSEAHPTDLAMVESAGGDEYKIRRERRANARLTASLPDLSSGLARYEERVRKIIDCCRERGLYVAFTTQPVLWDAGLVADVASRCWFGWLPDGTYLELAALRRAMDTYNQRLLKVCAATGVPCVDLSALNGRPECFYDDCHFTEEGAEEVGRLVARGLESTLPRN